MGIRCGFEIQGDRAPLHGGQNLQSCVGSRSYRLQQLRKVIDHIKTDVEAIHVGFAESVPNAPTCCTKGASSRIPPWPRTKMILGIIESQLPWHDPERGHVVAYHGEWRGAGQAGKT